MARFDGAYIKYFGQYFHYVPLQGERRERFTNEILRPRFVYAVGVRLGLGHGFGDSSCPAASGSSRAAAPRLGDLNKTRSARLDRSACPLGGEAMFVINNELRVPLLSIFDGVVFSDIGNVFPRVADFSLSDLRKTAGVGLRARTRWFLLRGDYGLLLETAARASARGRFYFSLGQAF